MRESLRAHYWTLTLAVFCGTNLLDVTLGNAVNESFKLEQENAQLQIKPTRATSNHFVPSNQDTDNQSHEYLSTSFSLINVSHDFIHIKNNAKRDTKPSQSLSQNRTKIARSASTDVISDSLVYHEDFSNYVNTFYTTHYSQDGEHYFYKTSDSHEYSAHAPNIEHIFETTSLSTSNNLLRPVIPSILTISSENIKVSDCISNEPTVTLLSSKNPTDNTLSSSKSVIVIVPYTSTPDYSDFNNDNNNNNKVDVLNRHRDSNESENKDLGVIIKPTPSQGETESEMKNKKEVIHEVTPRSHTPSDQMDSLTSIQSQIDKTDGLKLETLSYVTFDSSELKAKDGKTPGLKSLPSSISIETIGLFSVGSTMHGETLSTTFTATAVDQENEISNAATVLLTDIPDRQMVTDVSPAAPTRGPPVANRPQSCISDIGLCRPRMFNLTLSFTWPEFCPHSEIFRMMLFEMLNMSLPENNVTPQQIVIVDSQVCGKSQEELNDTEIRVSVYVTDKNGKWNYFLTSKLRKQLRPNTCPKPSLCTKITKYHHEDDNPDRDVLPSPLVLSNSGFVAGVSISVVAALCIILMGILMLVLRWRSSSASLDQGGIRRAPRPSFDAYSLASFSSGQRKRKSRISLRSFLNQAFEDPEIPSRPLNLNNLTTLLSSRHLLEDEFKKLPLTMPLPETVPAGAEAKNRYSNVIPVPGTRVRLLAVKSNDPVAEYINANTVRGYGGKSCQYIACQAPLAEGMEDFWRMVWEQQSRMILMLTLIQENGIQRCAPYFPDNTVDCHRSFGDFQVTLQNKDVREHFTVSTLRLYEMEKNLFRDVIHLWYRSWPPHSVPSDVSTILAFMLETRKHSQRNAGPIIVHCSPGTGRTGTIMTIDSCMREYDESRLVDVPRCIYRLRQDRAGAVQTPEQYIFIHEVLLEYCLKIGTQSQRPSLKSLISFKMSH